ncbi:MAG: hypothetical protein K0S33_137 [Bacteroidetes bacterium]|jgi:hypothetical protein|nr:hypothetical protein [Bacteroidota bacterium]
MIEIAALASLAIIVTITIVSLRRDRKSQDKIHLKNLDNELLYEPKTGVSYTLDEVESGDILFSDPNRIKTRKEIETFFNEDEIGVELARNYLRKKGYKQMNSEREPNDLKFDSISWWENYRGVYTDTVFEINPAVHLYFVSLTYVVTGYKGRTDMVTEIQLMLWLKKTTLNQLNYLKSCKDLDSLQLGTEYLFKRNKIADIEGVKILLNKE